MARISVLLSIPALLLATVMGAGAEGADDLWVKGRLLAGEDFSGSLSNWVVEGDADARIEEGRLRFEATTETDVKKGNIWWRPHFADPIQIEFDYQSATDYGLTMFWWHSHRRDGRDLLSYKRSGIYDEYVLGEMNGYHISFHRFKSGVSNFRKSFGFHMVATQPDPIPLKDLDNHHITIYNRGNHVRFLVDGKLVHDFHDEGKPCLIETEWLHEGPCKGTGKAFSEGKIGIRHTQRQTAFYDNLKVYRLVKP
ncbi:DUF1961 family protein [candidate division KSB1 bacterium]